MAQQRGQEQALTAIRFLHRELRRLDAKVDEKFDGFRTVVTTLQVSVARIEGHLGIGFPAADEQRPDDEPPCGPWGRPPPIVASGPPTSARLLF